VDGCAVVVGGGFVDSADPGAIHIEAGGGEGGVVFANCKNADGIE
jgi:hypothetical protein